MKRKDVEIGGRYTALVAGRLQVVRIVREQTRYDPLRRRERTWFEAVNEATGRTITIRSAQRLRRRVS
jgi:hypothetical protein